METDSRVEFVLGYVDKDFGKRGCPDHVLHSLRNRPEIPEFLDDASILVLLFVLKDGGNEVEATTEIQPSVDFEAYMFFYKASPCTVPHKREEMGKILKMTRGETAVRYLGDVLRFGSNASGEEFDDAVAKEMLRTLLCSPGRRKTGTDSSGRKFPLTLSQEHSHWKQVTPRSRHADLIEDLMENLTRELEGLDVFSFDEAIDRLDQSKIILLQFEIVLETYEKDRLLNLFDIMADLFYGFIKSHYSRLQVWEEAYALVHPILQNGLLLCNRWLQVVQSVSQQCRFPALGKRDDVLRALKHRTEEVDSVLSLYQQLKIIVRGTIAEAELKESHPFDSFESVDWTNVGADGIAHWNRAKNVYSTKMKPFQKEAGRRMARILSAAEGNPQQLIREFLNYEQILQWPEVRVAVRSEREMLLGEMHTMMLSLRSEFDTLTDPHEPLSRRVELTAAKGLSTTVSRILRSRQMQQRCDEIRSVTEVVLTGDFDVKSLLQRVAEQKTSLEKFEQEKLREWEDEIAGSSSLLFLDPNQGVARLDTSDEDGHLHVHYSERLLALIKEVRQLVALGYSVSPKIQRAAKDAERVHKYAVELKQVAALYNTLRYQAEPTQKPMLYQAARNLELAIRQHEANSIPWSDTKKVEAYITSVRSAADQFMELNRRLKGYHRSITRKMLHLMNLDLLKQQDKWKDALQSVRQPFTALSNSYDQESLFLWANFWDYQLYKVLEIQYKVGLECMHELLPEIMTSVVFENRKLVYRPSLEKMREKYYAEMRKVIAIPSRVLRMLDEREGSKPSGFFSSITDRNGESLIIVYEKAERLFDKLASLIPKLEKYVILGFVDMEELVEKHLTTLEDWDAAFRSLKGKGREIEKLKDEIGVDCFKVSTVALKVIAQNQLHSLSELLVVSLRKSAQSHLLEVQSFIQKGMGVVNTEPETLEEIGKINAEVRRIHDEKVAIEDHFQTCRKKSWLLSQVSGREVTNLDEMQGKWSEFLLLLEAHELRAKEQVESLRLDVRSRLDVFLENARRFNARWEKLQPGYIELDRREETRQALEFLEEFRQELDEMDTMRQTMEKECQYFGVEPPPSDLFVDLEHGLSLKEACWGIYKEFVQSLDAMGAKKWRVFMAETPHDLEDLVFRFLKESKERLSGRDDRFFSYFSEFVGSYRALLPMLTYIRGDGWSDDHWKDLMGILGVKASISSYELTVQNFLDRRGRILQVEDKLRNLHARAQGEVTIREALDELKVWSDTTQFTFVQHGEGEYATQLIKEWKDIVSQVGDRQSLVLSLKDSPYFASFEERATTMEKNLAYVDSCLQYLNQNQRKWVYLEPIFRRGALPQEQARFNHVDEQFREVLGKIAIDFEGVVMSLIRIDDLESTLKENSEQLDLCQKALNDFLEEKRSRFPRFYFIGDDDLLEILGQAQEPSVIQSHLKKLFAGIHHVIFDEERTKIEYICSLQGENVKLSAPVLVSGEVEQWLVQLDQEMRKTLHVLMLQCLDGDNDILNDLEVYPSQVLCLKEQIYFTRECESAIKNRCLGEFHKELFRKLGKYTSSEYDDDVVELKVKSLMLDLIHNMEVVSMLNREKIDSTAHWLWQKQLRYNLTPDRRGCCVYMCDASFTYTFEYQGNAPKLVHTPLTDKCYLTLTQGMHLGYGGNPYGPAGTGKTESVKALGQAMGRQVLVFNCDEGIDFHSMGRIFIGLVKCGAWGCFDEFNRLKEDQLSAVSQQIQVIQAAIKEGKKQILLVGRDTEVNPNAGIFVTMNPAGKGYGGRSKLPDNLKQLFRSVAMSIPDNDLIAEVILYSEGFAHAKDLGKKLVALFSLFKQLLMPMQHYDWGLRALKTVLGFGGKLIKQARQNGKVITREIEAEFLVQSLRMNTLSKLAFEDVKRFNGLVGDVFQGVGTPEFSHKELEEAIEAVMAEKRLKVSKQQMSKIVQFYQILQQRMGVVIVGPSGSGKTTIWRILRSALKKIGQKITKHVMNPKAMPRNQLLGYMDVDTREWFDGVLTKSAREVVRQTTGEKSWIICDGDIDPEWIESLNSVLDDNHLLTMPSGERIQFGDNINFIFETHDLKFASPATVSRMGMVFLSEEDTDASGLIEKWIQEQPSETQGKLQNWIEQYFDNAVRFVEDSEALVVDTSKMGIIQNGLSHLKGVTTLSEFTIALLRGFGSLLNNEQERNQFAKLVFSWAGKAPPNLKSPFDTSLIGGNLVAYKYDATQTLDFEMFHSLPLVKTITMEKTRDILMKWIHSDPPQPILLVGPSGCGKSMVLESCFKDIKGLHVAAVHCSSQTTSQQLIQKLLQVCNIASGSGKHKVLRPREGSLVLFLRDLNLPKPDQYGTTQIVSFVQQLVTYNGFWNGLEWISMEKIQIVASMTPSSSVGRYPLTTRLTSVVRICYMPCPDRDESVAIYSNFLRALLKRSPPSGSEWKNLQTIVRLAQSSVRVFEQVSSRFTEDDQAHYSFSPRDMTLWMRSLLRYDLRQENLLDAWANECLRIFCDRLVGDGKKKLQSVLSGVLRQDWDHNLKDKNIYCGFSPDLQDVPPDDFGNRKLFSCASEDYITMLSESLRLYQRETKDLRVVLFREVLELVEKMDRVLCMKGGSLFLVGNSGSSRRSMISLLCHIHRMELLTLSLTRDYGTREFKMDLKNFLALAGVEGKEIVLFLEDHHFRDENVLESINSLLSSGEVPGLFTKDELEQLLSPLKEISTKEGYFGSLSNFFVERIRQNLHVVISMDHSNPSFQARCRASPALFTRCCVVWVDNWSRSSMMKIPSLLLEESLSYLSKQSAEEIVSLFVTIHESASELGTSPRKYIALLEAFRSIMGKKHKRVRKQVDRLEKGLQKLEEASDTVDELARDAEDKKKLLAVKQHEADVALQEISENMRVASEQKRNAEVLRVDLEREERIIQKQKGEIDAKLERVLPIVEEAKDSLKSLTSGQLAEIGALPMPPPQIRDVLEGVLRLMGNFDTSWNNMRKFLKGGKERILHFDVETVTPDILSSVQELLRVNAPSFEKKNIARVSKAAAPLAAWVQANVEYALVLQSIDPLRKEERVASLSLRKNRKELSDCLEKVDFLDSKVSTLKENFRTKTSEAESLRIQLQQAETTLAAARKLLEKLSGEQSRWGVQAKDLGRSLEELPRQCLAASGFLVYLGKMAEDVREEMVEKWKELARLESFSMRTLLSTEGQLLQRKAEGLPADDLSQENGICILEAVQTPLIIDPSQQASTWLRNHLKDSAVGITTPQDPKFTTTVELAIRFGRTLIIEEMDTIEALLYPLLRRDFQKQGPRSVVNIGDKLVDYNDNFRLFLVTRDSEPFLPPDAESLVCVVNFSVTRSGLEGQLLGITIQHEKPTLESQKSDLLKEEEDLKVKLEGLEKQLLRELAASQGNLLENKSLIDRLNEIKAGSQTISESLTKSHDLQASLDSERNMFRPFANLGSRMFFLISDLCRVNHMYQFSLQVFLRIFREALKLSGAGSGNVQARIAMLSQRVLRDVVQYVSRSLLKEDRLIFGMHLLNGLYPTNIDQEEWESFLGRRIAQLDEGEMSRVVPGWVPEERRKDFAHFVSGFPNVVRQMGLDEEEKWRGWLRSPQPEIQFPSCLSDVVSEFQKIAIVKTLRPDKLSLSMERFISKNLGISTTAASANLFDVLRDESNSNEPILFITTPGADPSREVEDVADQVVGPSKFQSLAMGEGQTEEALRMVRRASQDGSWVLLNNLHLVLGWIPVLEKELNTMKHHESFRLFMTTEAHDRFPTMLLRLSMKITVEAPPGMRQNLIRTYDAWKPKFSKGITPLHAQILFTLGWFHAVVQERRTYIPQGWTKFYEFSTSDMRAAGDIVESLCSKVSKGSQIDFLSIRGLLENAIYGGRVDDPVDSSVLQTFLQKYFCQDALESSKHGGKPFMKGVSLPTTGGHGDFVDIVMKIPEADHPSMFGLPLNASRLVQIRQGSSILDGIRLLSVSPDVVTKFDRGKWKQELLPYTELWSHLMSSNQEVLKRGTSLRRSSGYRLSIDQLESPMVTFVNMQLNLAARTILVPNSINPHLFLSPRICVIWSISAVVFLAHHIVSFLVSICRAHFSCEYGHARTECSA
eukprot:TRINITY_DN1890_c0_g1_i5.p1 TRINITY_DN1890_c0_g1~~TRINITY_DN1890_c0_g1_i5.p1  ORF type:complete len:4092 (-),score=1034.80 TRINITY_DN1890_c0_g1_i5:737-12970(-)